MLNYLYTCNQCGSPSVQMKVWVNPNTEKILEDISLTQEDCWCNDCREHVGLDCEELKTGRRIV